MKIVPKTGFRTLEEELEMERIVTQLKAGRRPRPPLPQKPEGMSSAEWEAKRQADIMALQTPHTQRVMKMSEEELEEYRNRPIPSNWKAVPNAKTTDEAVGKRDIDPNDAEMIQRMRRGGHGNTIGQSDKSSASAERKEMAKQALVYSQPAKVTPKEIEQRAVGLVQYESQPLEYEWKPLPWWKALLHWFKGNPIKREPEDALLAKRRIPPGGAKVEKDSK